MKVSGFTIVRNAVKYNYPVVESIRSILPICDEFIVNIGDCEDGTVDLIAGMKSDKIRIIHNAWDMSQKSEVLSHQTNLALAVCAGDWAFYLQSDEVIHEDDWGKLKNAMRRYRDDYRVDALRFQWLHFYGSYFRYRIDSGWYQKQDRIIRNNGQMESFGDAFGFRRKDGQPLRRKNTGCLVYHYGWVQPVDVMAKRRVNAGAIGFVALGGDVRREEYSYGDLNRFPVYFGTHPKVMETRIQAHFLSQEDWKNIKCKYWWFPAQWFRVRYKTGRRVKEKIE
jgi:hypothetical protein